MMDVQPEKKGSTCQPTCTLYWTLPRPLSHLNKAIGLPTGPLPVVTRTSGISGTETFFPHFKQWSYKVPIWTSFLGLNSALRCHHVNKTSTCQLATTYHGQSMQISSLCKAWQYWLVWNCTPCQVWADIILASAGIPGRAWTFVTQVIEDAFHHAACNSGG